MSKYIVVEKAYEYNDEYNQMQEGYTIKSKLFDNKEDAIKIGKKEAIINRFKDWKGNFNSSSFDFKMFNYYDEKCEDLMEYFKEKGYEFDADDYQLYLPKDLSEDLVLEAYNKWEMDLFDIIKIEE